jgi:hypothetical protein
MGKGVEQAILQRGNISGYIDDSCEHKTSRPSTSIRDSKSVSSCDSEGFKKPYK